MSAQYAKLIMVAVNDGTQKGAAQSNKYYEMEYDGASPNFNVKYGRVESTEQTATYPYYQWSKKYQEKIKKGYKDVTDLVSTEVKQDRKEDVELKKIDDRKVDAFLTLMKRYTDNLVSTTYSVKAENVSQKQVDEAQRIINELNKMEGKGQAEINRKLIELYTTIPRYMKLVTNHLIPNVDLKKVMVQEQDNLDAMASQVSMIQEPTKKEKKQNQTLLDILGITMSEGGSGYELKYLIDQVKGAGRRVECIFKIGKKKEDEIFDKWIASRPDKSVRMLIHGTRCTSVIPILEQGLKIRPAGNFQFSGKVYGDGNYFSEVVNKSLGYTGHDPDKVLLVYEVHTGNPFIYEGWYRGNSFSLTYSELSKRGYDSTHVKAGNGLLNSEIIAYREEQSRIKYLIWLK